MEHGLTTIGSKAAAALLFVLVFTTRDVQAETQILHVGHLLQNADTAVRSDVSLVVRDGRITEISDGFVNDFANQSATVVDLTDSYVLPGLIDCHTHITHDPYTFSRGRLAAETSFSEADWALLGVVQAKATLAAGFTTVRDVGGFRGGDGGAAFALRDAINRGLIDGPRILTAGQAISVVGGHADVHGFRS
ncbi:MAG: amidohydrolase family protein, partial [Pseudomonadota bacterium]